MRDPETGNRIAVDRAQDPLGWERWASLDVPIVTQWDDGNHSGSAPGQLPTSSSSKPSLVAAMIDDLDVRPGHRVLDVGTGTGWTAALLSSRVGDGNVTSVEVDAAVSLQAVAKLKKAGFAPRLVTGDGAAVANCGPFDRVHGTYAVQQIPYRWIEQTRPGGIIIVPWGTRFARADAVARLTVRQDGTASGHFTRLVEFMRSRSERAAWPNHSDYLPADAWPAGTRESETTLHPDQLLESPETVAEFVVGTIVPNVVYVSSPEHTTYYGLTDTSWAIVYSGDDGPRWEVYQGGPRNLWNEVEATYARWLGWGRPDITRFGMTVTPDGSRVWLDHPSEPLS